MIWNTDCPNPSIVDNGLCNDEVNNEECNYDGGDCCGTCVNIEHCMTCVCYEGGEPSIDLSCKRSFYDTKYTTIS